MLLAGAVPRFTESMTVPSFLSFTRFRMENRCALFLELLCPRWLASALLGRRPALLETLLAEEWRPLPGGTRAEELVSEITVERAHARKVAQKLAGMGQHRPVQEMGPQQIG